MNGTQTPTGPQAAVRRLADLSCDDVAFAGGKGASLGELHRAGMPVPPGFVVAAPAYAASREENGLRARLSAELDALDAQDASALGAGAKRARDMVAAAPVPAWLERAIVTAYRELSGKEDMAVSVRSSATAELTESATANDAEPASFAGVNETYLNVLGAAAVVEAVRRCWASLFNGRTVFYRAKRGLSPSDLDIAVVVQRHVASTRAGVMVTTDPSTGRADRMVIEGAYGLGSGMVSGRVSPDRYVVDKRTRAIVAREVKAQRFAIRPMVSSGTVTCTLSDEECRRPVLDDAEILVLADLAVRIERHYGAPQDTQWAFDPDGEPWMLQSRPVTWGPY